MKRRNHVRRELRGSTRESIVLARIGCTLSLMLGACGQASPPDRLADPALSSELRDEQAEEDQAPRGQAAAVGAAAEAASSLRDCVSREIKKHGSAAAVTELLCPGADGASRDDAADLDSLSTLTNLTTLDLSSRCVLDVRPLSELSKLLHLQLRDNQVKDIGPLAALHDLRSLGLANNRVASSWVYKTKEPLLSLSRLEELNLDGTRVNNILPLESLSALRVLSLRGLGLKTLHSLRSLHNLEELHVDENPISDLSPLEGLAKLKALTATRASIDSVDPLLRLAKDGSLQTLALDENCITQCERLEGMDVSCTGQSESCEDLSELVPAGALKAFGSERNINGRCSSDAAIAELGGRGRGVTPPPGAFSRGLLGRLG